MKLTVLSIVASALGGAGCGLPCAPCRCAEAACGPTRAPSAAPFAEIGGATAAARQASEYRNALDTAHRAVLMVPRLVAGLGDEQGARARGQHVGTFEVGTEAAMRLGDAAEATFFLESGRAGSLLESLGARGALRGVVTPDELRRVEADASKVEADASVAYDLARETGDLSAVRAAREAVARAQDRVLDAVERSERAAKAAARLRYPVALPIDDIRGLLEPREALVTYGIFEKNAMAVVLARGAARIVPLGESAKLASACAALAEAHASSDWSAHLAHLRSLLIAPLALANDTRRLLISADGPLFRVPFAALVDGVSVAYVPSGTAYGVLREERAKRGEGVLALGDSDRGPKAAAPGDALGRFTRLPVAGAEARAVGDVVLLGADASEGRLTAALATRPRWRALHLATHLVIDWERAGLSSVVLASDADEDGYLRAIEISRSKIDADLVVLSACESARGTLFRGEGMLGLPRAFLLAGVPRVIGSLWKVDDEATRALMVKLYELWNPKDGKPGLPTAEALEKAQEYVKSQKKWKHPNFWAAWVLWGLPD